MSLSYISISSISSRLAFYSPYSPAPYSFPSTPLPPALHLLCLLLFWPYLSFIQSLFIYPGPPPPTSQGSGHLIYRACLLHWSLHFPPLVFDRQVPPPPFPSPSASISITAHERGRCREGGGRDRVHPQDSGRRADRQMGKGLQQRRGRQAVESTDGLKGLPLLGTEGTGRLRHCCTGQTEALADSCP